jgi:hypothetical protein
LPIDLHLFGASRPGPDDGWFGLYATVGWNGATAGPSVSAGLSMLSALALELRWDRIGQADLVTASMILLDSIFGGG